MTRIMAQREFTWKAVRLTSGTAPASFSSDKFGGTGARKLSATVVNSAQLPAAGELATSNKNFIFEFDAQNDCKKEHTWKG